MITKATQDQVRDLSAADIFGIDDTAPQPLVVPGWKGRVYIKPMTAERALDFGKQMRDPARKDEGMIRGIIESVCDATGNLLFTVDDYMRLQKKSISALNLIQNKMLELNSLDSAASSEVQEKEIKND